MENVLIVAHLLIVLALISVILLQRSEGGGLGMGGGSNSGGLISVRGSANLLTRTTGILAALFFATSIGLTVLSQLDRGSDSILDQAAGGGQTNTSVLDALNALDGGAGDDLPVPDSDASPVGDGPNAANGDGPAEFNANDLPVPGGTDTNTDPAQ